MVPGGCTEPVGRIGPAGRTAGPEGCTAAIVARTVVADGRPVAMDRWWTPKTAYRPRCPGRCRTACRIADCLPRRPSDHQRRGNRPRYRTGLVDRLRSSSPMNHGSPLRMPCLLRP